ncbi:MAG: polyprenyl synthetase family protein [Polyangiaceae bacterium]|nr:polyprenyl synthetase family protein [Polyangiaceae bacterium]
MTLPVVESLGSLQAGARARRADPRLEERLRAAEELLGDDLRWVETSLRGVAGEGPEPAVSAARHLVELGGKRVRPATLLLASACVGEIGPVARELAVVVELVHSATLLHDDVVDDGMVRRGAVTARRRHGNAVSVLAGDLLLVTALERAASSAAGELPELLSTLRRLVEGEVLQLAGRTALDASEATYLRIVDAKTASLFSYAAAAGARAGGGEASHVGALDTFGGRLGLAFQLVDDVLDYQGDRAEKSLLTDLAEGKVTLPLALAVARDAALLPLLGRVQAGDAGPVEELGRAVASSGVCEEVRLRAERATEEAVAALEPLPATPARALLVATARGLAGRAR